MHSRHVVLAARWLYTLAALAGIILVYRRWFHVNQTTVALTLVLFILLIAARLGLRYAVIVSVVATACYNYYFLPPLYTFVINDPENWLALFAFLGTSVVGSRLSQKARDEADRSLKKQRELELLFALSRDLLQTQNVADVVNAVPALINVASRAASSTLYLLEGDRVYQAGIQQWSAIELPHFRQSALTLTAPQVLPHNEVYIPLRAGIRPRGLLRLSDVQLSNDTLQAIGGLTSIAIDRAQALEDVARGEATKESERLRTLILDSITHELRTPLTSIKGATGILLTTENLSEADRTELLTIIEEEVDKLNRMIAQVVETAQIESQEVHMNFASTTLAEVVKQAMQSCAWVADAHPLDIQVKPILKVYADAEMVSKVLCNLLENAAKYSEPKSPIFVTAEERNGSIVISVADRGVGIESSEQDLIFDRLYRSRMRNLQVPGTGMGLAISKAIVEANRGTLAVTSQVGRGSVFSFSLPAATE